MKRRIGRTRHPSAMPHLTFSMLLTLTWSRCYISSVFPNSSSPVCINSVYQTLSFYFQHATTITSDDLLVMHCFIIIIIFARWQCLVSFGQFWFIRVHLFVDYVYRSETWKEKNKKKKSFSLPYVVFHPERCFDPFTAFLTLTAVWRSSSVGVFGSLE